MQKKFIINLSLLLLTNLLIKPFWVLVVDAEVQNRVGAEEFGMYFAIMNFTFLFNILLDFGLTNFNNRNIAMHDQLLNKHMSSLLVLKITLGVIYFFIIAGLGLFIGYGWDKLKMLSWLAFNQFLISLILYLRSNITGLHLFKTDSIISVLDRFLMIVISAAFLWGNITSEPFKIEWFIYIQTAGYGINAIIALILVGKRAKRFTLNWNYPFFLMILKQSFPFAILVLLMSFYNRIDSVMIERILPDGAFHSGIYAQGYRLLDAVNMIGYLFAALLLPIFAKMLKLNQAVEELTNLSFRILVGGALIIGTVCYFFSKDIMTMIYKDNIEEAAGVFQLLMICFIPIASTYIFGTLLTANSSLKQLNIMALCGMVLNISLNFILIPKWQAIGAAWSSLSTQIITALIQFILVHRIFHFKLNFMLAFKFTIYGIGLISLGFGFQNFFDLWWFNFFAVIGGSILLAFLTKIISLKAIYNIVKYGD